MRPEKWWDYQGVDWCKEIPEFEMTEEIIIRRIELECIDEGYSGSYFSPPEPPAYAPMWEEMIVVKPCRKWFGRALITKDMRGGSSDERKTVLDSFQRR